VAGIVDHAVPAAGAFSQPVHRVPDGSRDPGVERVHRLPGLEVHVRVLRGAADERMVRGQPAGAMLPHQLLRDERAQVVVGQQLDRVQLV